MATFHFDLVSPEKLLFTGEVTQVDVPGSEGSNTAQDIRNMGNLRKYMPTTWLTYMAGYLALAGFPFLFSGFWSKDEILADAFGHGHYIVWIVLTLASFLTAFYMTRQVWVVFFGSFRGHNPRIATHPSDPRRWSMRTSTPTSMPASTRTAATIRTRAPGR